MESGLEALAERVDGLDANVLAEREAFSAIAIEAFQVATRNHEQGKLDAVRNVVLNAAVALDVDADEQAMFMRYVDELTLGHLRLLAFLDDPERWFAENGLEPPSTALSSNLGSIIEAGMPELRDKQDLYGQWGDDLSSRGLAGSPGFKTMMTADGWKVSRTTALGKRFIAAIDDPGVRKD